VAVDPNVIPFRSEVYVPGYGIGFAGDTGGGVKGRWIDLGYDEDELQTWNGYTDVYYLTPIPAEINYLLPEVLP
jgi:3D (Asp-Asp-Asp) domain-containing protein